jgi:protein-glutamine gamma-glutamyltransferase
VSAVFSEGKDRLWTLFAAGVCLLPLLLQLPGTLALGVAIVALATPVLARNGSVSILVRLLLAMALLATVMLFYRFSFGRDTGCALLATMLALKPVELRNRRDARSLLGFALFAPFATFLLDQGPVSLMLGLASLTVALMAMSTLSESESESESGETDRLVESPLQRLRNVGRMALIGLPLALVVFWLFPRLVSPLWGVPDRAVTKPGLSDRMSPGDWVDLLADDSPALRATFFGAQPEVTDLYWRGPVFWNFDGRSWSALRWSGADGQQPAEAMPSAKRYDYEMELEPTDRRQMVALDLPLSAPNEAVLDRDFSLRAYQPLAALTRWRMQSAMPARFETELSPWLRQRALRLPEGFNPKTIALAQRWRQEADARYPDKAKADMAIVNRMLGWIGKEFAYTLDAEPLGRDTVDEFLFKTRAGFCEHFSSSFVVVMRAAGVPARVVTGYTGGYLNPIGNYWLVRRSDAHAWSEVWLEGRGWTRIDPTAAVAPERIYDTIDDRAPGNIAGFAGLGPVFDVSDWMRRGWNDFVLGFNANRQRQLFSALGMPDMDSSRLTQIFILCTLLALGGMWWLTTRNERERDPLLRAWRRLEQRYRRIGLSRERHEPAQRWAERIARNHGGAHSDRQRRLDALHALSARFAHWRYARREGQDNHAPDDRALKALIRDIRRHRPPPKRG